jgi:hypothetical protein
MANTCSTSEKLEIIGAEIGRVIMGNQDTATFRMGTIVRVSV